MTLVGLTSLLVGGIGVANGVRAWLEARARGIATLRCLGASPRLVFFVFLTADTGRPPGAAQVTLNGTSRSAPVATRPHRDPQYAWVHGGRLPARRRPITARSRRDNEYTKTPRDSHFRAGRRVPRPRGRAYVVAPGHLRPLGRRIPAVAYAGGLHAGGCFLANDRRWSWSPTWWARRSCRNGCRPRPPTNWEL